MMPYLKLMLEATSIQLLTVSMPAKPWPKQTLPNRPKLDYLKSIATTSFTPTKFALQYFPTVLETPIGIVRELTDSAGGNMAPVQNSQTLAVDGTPTKCSKTPTVSVVHPVLLSDSLTKVVNVCLTVQALKIA